MWEGGCSFSRLSARHRGMLQGVHYCISAISPTSTAVRSNLLTSNDHRSIKSIFFRHLEYHVVSTKMPNLRLTPTLDSAGFQVPRFASVQLLRISTQTPLQPLTFLGTWGSLQPRRVSSLQGSPACQSLSEPQLGLASRPDWRRPSRSMNG